MAVPVLLFVFVFFLLSLALFWRPGWLPLQTSSSHSSVHRLLKPRTPDGCPACRLASPGVEPASAPVRPWREVKSRRGAPKRLPTDGFACPNQQCLYFGITDAHIHALVGDGKHGQAEHIQTFRCQACHATITRRLTRSGEHAQILHERSFRNLHIPHLQLDEIRTRLRSHTQVLWLWLAIDPCTKMLPVLGLGPRTQHLAHRLIHSLRQILAPGCLPLFTSDGLNLSFYALTAHFGQGVQVVCRGRKRRQWQVAAGTIYGQVKKCYRRRKLIGVTHVMRLGAEASPTVALQAMGFSGRLNTAFIERVNLTVRHGIAALARRTWAAAQQSPSLLAHLEWWRAYYHFVRPHQSLQVTLVQPRERGGKLVAQRYRQCRPAMAAGRTTRRWTTREVLACPLPRVSA